MDLMIRDVTGSIPPKMWVHMMFLDVLDVLDVLESSSECFKYFFVDKCW